jgi:RNA polymerase sigma-70 factor (ECF subfamily)
VDEGSGEVTLLLRAMEKGDRGAANKLLPLLYGELRQLAGYYMKSERSGHTLQPTALVHEAYLKLATQDGDKWQNRAHFVSVAARAMKQVLVDYARTHRRSKRGGGAQKLSLDEVILFSSDLSEEVLALDLALEKLEDLDHRQCTIVELRCFGGLTVEEIGEVIQVSPMTVKREWTSALAWLSHEMSV